MTFLVVTGHIVRTGCSLPQSVDATYHSDLRELNELNFARFEAKLKQRFAQQDAKWEQRMAAMSAEIHAIRADLIKWMFLFWAGTALPGLLLR